MENELKAAFHRYAQQVRGTLESETQYRRDGKIVSITPNDPTALRALIEVLEKGTGFGELVEKTRHTFSGDYHGRGGWSGAVQNFFRRSGYYIDIFDGKPADDEGAFQRCRTAFAKRDVTVNYLLPLEYVHFARNSMDFGTFSIRKFTQAELNDQLSNRVNEVFYPYARIDVERIRDYWFICVSGSEKSPRLGYLDLDLSDIYRVHPTYTAHEPVVESTLRQLALYNWEDMDPYLQADKDPKEAFWLRFHVPFTLRVDDNLLGWPRRAPDLSTLDMVPIILDTREEVGEEPDIRFHLNQPETESFVEFTQRTGTHLSSVRERSDTWNFLDIALGFFIKAYFAHGLEQLLWHITTIEALLGQKEDEGVRGPLARRITSILGNTNKEKETLKKQFNELYDFRCALVHGQVFKKDVYKGHLRNARSIARRTLLWFIHYLALIQSAVDEDSTIEHPPSRKDILMLLDLEEDSRIHLRRLVDRIPPGFPYVPEWLE